MVASPEPDYGSRTGQGARCPRCGGSLVRIRRLPIDRLVSLVSPRRRYRCAALGCGWKGTLRAQR